MAARHSVEAQPIRYASTAIYFPKQSSTFSEKMTVIEQEKGTEYSLGFLTD